MKTKLPQCVFVELGFISFKICRKNFECSHCDFAQTILDFGPLTFESPARVRMVEQLRRCIKTREEKAKRQIDQEESKIMHGLLELDVPKDRYYHRSHIWALPLSNRRFRLGVDELAQLLLQTIMGVQVSSDKSTGFTVWDLSCMGRMVQIPCPLAGKLVDVNTDVLMDPQRIHEDPYDKGWLIDLDVQKEIDSSKLIRGEAARAWMSMEMESVRGFDAAMTDGGELTHNPARWIPEPEWRKLVDTYLIQPTKKNLL